MRRRVLALVWASLLSVVVLSPVAGAAESYPTRPITLVVPFAVGGGNDALARLVAEYMGRSLGQSVIVDNRAGGGGVVGTRFVAKSQPDGYTLLLGFTGTMAVNPVLYKSPGYDTHKDFEPIGRIGSLPMVLVVNAASKWMSLKDVIDYAKRNPGKVTYGSGGAGTLLHIAAEMVAARGGIQLSHIPYRSTGPAVIDLLGGQIDMMFSPPVAVSGNIADGKLRVIAVTSTSRLPAYPSVPTLAEAALPGFYALPTYGLLAPAKTPSGIVTVLNKALNEALNTDQVKKRLAADTTEPLPGTPQEYASSLNAESETWGSTVKKLGISASE